MLPTPPTGLVPVLATPFTHDGSLDLTSLRRILEFQGKCGVEAVAVFGMASEGFTLSAGDRATILSTLHEVAPEMHVVAGIAASGLSPALEQLDALVEGGADTAMVMPPHMVKPSPAQTVDFFAAIARRAGELGVGIMVQDAPGATGVELSADTIAQVCEADEVMSVKIEAPPTLVKFESVAPVAARTGTTMLGGMNAQFVLDEYALGSRGTMPACEFSDLLAAVLTHWESGDEATARKMYAALLPLLVWGLQPGIAHAIHKEILLRRGLIETAVVRAPARPITAAMREATGRVFDVVVHDVSEAGECSPVPA